MSSKILFSQIESLAALIRSGVRLELRPQDRDHKIYDYLQAKAPGYFEHVVGDASLAFQALFEESEPLVLLFRSWGSRRRRQRKNAFWRQQLSQRANQGVVMRKTRSSQRGLWVKDSATTTVRGELGHALLFAAIANHDFGRTPSLGGRLYFFSLKRSRAFHMYDDRGLMLGFGHDDNLKNELGQLNVIERLALPEGFSLIS